MAYAPKGARRKRRSWNACLSVCLGRGSSGCLLYTSVARLDGWLEQFKHDLLDIVDESLIEPEIIYVTPEPTVPATPQPVSGQEPQDRCV